MNKNIGIYPKLTKDYILDRISQEQIMEEFLGIPVTNNTLIANSVLSPFRLDKNPTCNYWYNQNNKLRFRDWNGSFHGDCFDVVGKVEHLNPNNRKGFMMILKIIAKTFRIHEYEHTKFVRKKRIIKDNTTKSEKDILRFKIIPRRWNYHDAAYWYNKYNLEPNDLIDVYPVNDLYIIFPDGNYKLVYTYSKYDSAYSYYGGKTLSGIDKWKIYFPLRKKKDERPRFLENVSFLQGERILVPSQIGGITKAYKDVLCFRKMGISTVAPSAESVILTKDEYYKMKYYFDHLFSTMDYDRTGLHSSWVHRKLYNIEPIMFTNGMFNSINFEAKDLSDFIELYGYDEAKEVVLKTYKGYKEELDTVSNELKNKLKWI